MKTILIGIFSVSIIVVLNSFAHTLVGDFIPMSLFLSSTLIAAWLGGTRAGLVALAFGGFVEFLFLKGAEEKLDSKIEMFRFVINSIEGLILCYVFGRVHNYQIKLAEKELALSQSLLNEQKARQTAESASETKSLFLANMSHEMRTPLSAVLGYADLLKDKLISDAECEKYIQIIENTGNSLKNIINDILDLTKVESGHLELERIIFSPQQVIDEVYSLFKVSCSQKQLHFTFSQLNLIPSRICGDPTRMKQILVNLIGNAIKFTHSGQIIVEYGTQGSDLFFKFKDTGIGITQEQKSRLFTNFSQGDNSISRRYSGTGLGLSLSRQLARKMGGDLKLVESEPNLGATFLATWKFEVVKDHQVHHPVDSTQVVHEKYFLGKKILLVDDSFDNLFLLEKILERWGVETEKVTNGLEAVRLTEKRSYDAVLMDMQMPIMDGYTATKMIRDKNNAVPIIAFTAHAMKEDRDRCVSVGCDGYVAKPVHKRELADVLFDVFSGSNFFGQKGQPA